MNAKRTMLIAAAGSLALILGALAFQYAGYPPCKLCYWQRYPHYAAIAIGAGVLILGPLALLGVAGALSALVTAGIGLYHSGVERGYWEGPTSCTGSGDGLAGMTGDELLSLDVPVDIVMCDEVAWSFAGLSMASWNAIFSLIIASIWFRSLRELDRQGT